MKGFRTLSALLLSFAMLSCADNLKEGQSAGDSVSVKAEIVATKVVLGDDSGETTEIFWQDGDQINQRQRSQRIQKEGRGRLFQLVIGRDDPQKIIEDKDAYRNGVDPLKDRVRFLESKRKNA